MLTSRLSLLAIASCVVRVCASQDGETTEPHFSLRTVTESMVSPPHSAFFADIRHEHFPLFWGCVGGFALLCATVLSLLLTLCKWTGKHGAADSKKVGIEMTTSVRKSSELEFNEVAKVEDNESFRL